MLKFVYTSSHTFVNSFLRMVSIMCARFYCFLSSMLLVFVLISSPDGRTMCTMWSCMLFIFCLPFAVHSYRMFCARIVAVLVNRKPYKRTHDTLCSAPIASRSARRQPHTLAASPVLHQRTLSVCVRIGARTSCLMLCFICSIRKSDQLHTAFCIGRTYTYGSSSATRHRVIVVRF